MTDLELLARNVHSWPDDAFAVIWRDNGPVWLNEEDANNTTVLPIFVPDWRAERERLQNKPKWEDAPKWANWLVQDSMKLGGTWVWYELKPVIDSDEWEEELTCSGKIEWSGSGQVIGDWKQTLEQRPKSKLEEKTKMEYKFKVGDKVEVIKSGYGCFHKALGTVSTITELGFYAGLPGYKVNNLKNERYDDFIGEDSFKLYSPVVIEADHQDLNAYLKRIHAPAAFQLEEQVLETQSKFKKAPDILSAGIERTAPVTSTMSSLYPDYYKSCVGVTELDVYTVHHLFNINDPSGCIQHASKKLLLSGVRTGGKSAYNDIKEARDTLTRKLQLMEQFEENV